MTLEHTCRSQGSVSLCEESKRSPRGVCRFAANAPVEAEVFGVEDRVLLCRPPGSLDRTAPFGAKRSPRGRNPLGVIRQRPECRPGECFHDLAAPGPTIPMATFRASAPALVDANARDRFRPRGCVRSDRRAHDRVQQKGGVERRQNRALAFTQTRAPESGPPSAHSGQGSTSRGPRAARSCVASRISSASLPACFTANAARSGRRQSECIRGGPHLAARGSGSLRREPSPKLRPTPRVHDVSFQN